MTTFTIGTGVTQRFEALTGAAGDDTFNINGGTLVIDTDVRYCANHTGVTGPLGAIAFDAAQVGELLFDGRNVRLIPFDTGSGTVPAAGTAITQGGVSATLLGVWSALNVEPTAAAATMPAAGFIKVRDKTGGSYAAGALTGITANAKRADVTGWIEIAGVDGRTIAIPRQGKHTVRGAWFSAIDSDGVEITTSGSRGQTIQLPASLTHTYYAGVWIETGAATGIYELWPSSANIVNANLATDARAQHVWISAQGLVRIGSDGTNNVGLLPGAGRRIRVPNILLVNCTTAAGRGINVEPVSTQTSRYRWDLTNNGVVDISILNGSWGAYFANGYSIKLYNYGCIDYIRCYAASSPLDISNLIVAPRLTTAPDLSACAEFIGCSGEIVDSTIVKVSGTSNNTSVVTSNKALNWRRVRVQWLQPVTQSAQFCWTILGNDNYLEDCIGIGSPALSTSGTSGVQLKNFRYASQVAGTVPTTFNVVMIQFFSGVKNFVLDGLSWFITTANTCHPYGNVIGAGVSDTVTIRNIGTQAAPLDFGSTNPSFQFLPTGFENVFTNYRFQRVYTTGSFRSGTAIDAEPQMSNVTIESCRFSSQMTVRAQNTAIKALRYTTAPAESRSAVYGLHFYDGYSSDTVGRIAIIMNDVSSLSTGQVAVLAGSPRFTGAGTLINRVIGGSIEWTMPYFAKGHTSMSTIAVTSGTTSNFTLEFRADVGSGWGSWQTASNANLAAVTIDPAIGVKLGVRMTCAVTNASSIPSIIITTVTTAAAQLLALYPLDTLPITVNGVVAGSQIKIVRTDTNAVLVNEVVSGTTYAGTFDLPVATPMRIELRKASGSAPYYQPWFTVGSMTATGITVTALQIED